MKEGRAREMLQALLVMIKVTTCQEKIDVKGGKGFV